MVALRSRQRNRGFLSRVALSRNLKKGGTMKVQRVVFALMGMMLLFAGQSSAQQVKTDYDRNANFGQYKTYSWEKAQTKDPFMPERIKQTVNSTPAAQGWALVPSGGDVDVFAIEVTQNSQTMDTCYKGFA